MQRKLEIMKRPKPPTVIPEIVDEGRRVVRPDVLQVVFLANIASHTAKMSKVTQALYDHALDLAGEGMTRLMQLTVTDKLKKLLLPEPWQSVSIANDGHPTDVEAEPTVYVRVNSLYTNEIPIYKGETLNYDTKTHRLKRLFLRCGSNQTATIRIIGNY